MASTCTSIWYWQAKLGTYTSDLLLCLLFLRENSLERTTTTHSLVHHLSSPMLRHRIMSGTACTAALFRILFLALHLWSRNQIWPTKEVIEHEVLKIVSHLMGKVVLGPDLHAASQDYTWEDWWLNPWRHNNSKDMLGKSTIEKKSNPRSHQIHAQTAFSSLRETWIWFPWGLREDWRIHAAIIATLWDRRSGESITQCVADWQGHGFVSIREIYRERQ